MRARRACTLCRCGGASVAMAIVAWYVPARAEDPTARAPSPAPSTPTASAATGAPPPMTPAASHPPDPFVDEYVVPQANEVGTTAGQFRAIGSGYLALGPGGPSLGAHGTLELMTFAYLGVRGSLQADALPPARGPSAWIAKTGPSLHLAPYHRFDVSVFFEAGLGVLDPFEAHHTAMPVLCPGATLEMWIASSWFLRGEGHIDWGIYELGDGPRAHLREVGLLGLGYAL